MTDYYVNDFQYSLGSNQFRTYVITPRHDHSQVASSKPEGSDGRGIEVRPIEVREWERVGLKGLDILLIILYLFH